MASTRLSERKLNEIRQFAEGWGKLLAREAFPNGPGLDVSLADTDDIVAVATRALVKGSVETMTGQQSESLDEQIACPTCGKLCDVEQKTRDVIVRGGDVSLDEPKGHCSRCRRDFPLREVWQLGGHGYSPTILHCVMHMSGVVGSFDTAQVALKVVGDIDISDRHINELTVEIGSELQQDRDQRTND